MCWLATPLLFLQSTPTFLIAIPCKTNKSDNIFMRGTFSTSPSYKGHSLLYILHTKLPSKELMQRTKGWHLVIPMTIVHTTGAFF